MHINYLLLENFIGIYNGLDQKKIELDFSKCKNKFILLAGANGSGKSTLLGNLHPFSNLNENKIIRKNKKGYKEIQYIDKDNKILYIIKHFYEPKGDSHSVKSYITKTNLKNGNSIELNENGNVGSFNDAVLTELGIDPGFIQLVRLGNEMRGLIEMTSTKRKEYISKFTEAASIYLTYYKKVNDDCRLVKKLIKNVSDKLEKLDDKQDIKEELKFIENNITKFQKDRDALLSTINVCKGKLSVLDPNNDIEERFNDYDVKRKYLEDNISSNDVDTHIDENVIKDKIAQMDVQSKIMTVKIMDLEKSLSKLILEKTSLENKINDLNINLNNVKSEKTLDEIKKLISFYSNIIDKFEKSYMKEEIPNISKEELLSVNSIIESIDNIVDVMSSEFPEYIINDYFTIDRSQLKAKYMKHLNDIRDAEGILSNLDNELESNKKVFEEINKLLAKRPVECKIDTCPFIANAISRLKECSDYEKKADTRHHLVKRLTTMKSNNDFEMLIKMDGYMNNIISIINQNKYVLDKIPECRLLFKEQKLIDKIKAHKSVIDINTIQYYITLVEESNMYDESKSKLKYLRKDYDLMMVNERIINSLKNDINKNEESLNEVVRTINKAGSELDELKEKYDKTIKELKYNVELVNNIEKCKEYIIELKDIRIKIKQYEAVIDDVRQRKKFIKENESKLNYLENSLNTFLNKRDKLVFKYKQCKKFNKEKSVLEEHYKDIDILRNALSNKNGAPMIFVEVYLKYTKVYANMLLENAFNGKFLLDDFDINDKEFRIPCYGKGERNADISSASSGEKSLVALAISLAMVKQQNKNYGVLQLDELDGPLDKKHRRLFVNLLDKSCENMNFEQVFIISHNDTFNNYDVSYILLKDHRIEDTNGLDIIYEY